MKFVGKTILLLILLALPCPVPAKEWHGIVPLHSTRQDVERLLGLPNRDRTYVVFYELTEEEIIIFYSRGSCRANRGGWNAPYNTVTSITVIPKRKPKLAEIKLDLSKFRKEMDFHVEHIFYYRDEREGVSYEVDSSQGELIAVRYFPSLSENNLRCPTSDNDLYNTVKIDEYSAIGFSAEKKRLDAFAQKLFRYDTTLGYIMVYAGRRARSGEARRRGERAKEYLVNVWGFDEKRIVFIDGGNRKEFTAELYLVPYGATPPASKPTIHPDDVQIIKP